MYLHENVQNYARILMFYNKALIWLIFLNTIGISAQLAPKSLLQPYKVTGAPSLRIKNQSDATEVPKKITNKQNQTNNNADASKKKRGLVAKAQNIVFKSFEWYKTIGLESIWRGMLTKPMRTKKIIGSVTILDLLSCVTAPLVLGVIYYSGIKCLHGIDNIRMTFINAAAKSGTENKKEAQPQTDSTLQNPQTAKPSTDAKFDC